MGGDVLSQAEVESLLNAMSANEEAPNPAPAGASPPPAAPDRPPATPDPAPRFGESRLSSRGLSSARR